MILQILLEVVIALIPIPIAEHVLYGISKVLPKGLVHSTHIAWHSIQSGCCWKKGYFFSGFSCTASFEYGFRGYCELTANTSVSPNPKGVLAFILNEESATPNQGWVFSTWT